MRGVFIMQAILTSPGEVCVCGGGGGGRGDSSVKCLDVCVGGLKMHPF